MGDLECVLISFQGRAVRVRGPGAIVAEVASLFPESLDRTDHPTRSIVVSVDEATGLFDVEDDIEGNGGERLPRDHVAGYLVDRIVTALICDLSSAVALHAGAVARAGKAILVPGQTGAGKSSLVAWLIDNGFEYLTDEIAVVERGAMVDGLRRALVIKQGSTEQVARLPAFAGLPPVVSRNCHLYALPRSRPSGSDALPCCSLIVLPQYTAGSDLRIETMSAAQAGLRLMQCNLNARNLPDGGLGIVGSLARAAPAISLQYGDFDQLAGAFDILSRITLVDGADPGSIRRFLSALTSPGVASSPPTADKLQPIPLPTPRPAGTPKALTIGMATYDDYDGVYFTLQALRLYQSDIVDDAEFIVVDNHPGGPCSEALKAIEKDIPAYRYIPIQERSGTAVRDLVFAEASSELVLCMDCHVMLVPGAAGRLLRYFRENPSTRDLLQGPMIYDDLMKFSTHFDPIWRGGMYGTWGTDQRGEDPDAPPFEIAMQGLGVFACRASVWPGFNPKFQGFGGEEGYIHEKFRQRGARTLCLPFLRWLHRFRRPMGLAYANTWEDRIRNYLIGHKELGLPTDEMESHFAAHLGEQTARNIIDGIRAELDAVP